MKPNFLFLLIMARSLLAGGQAITVLELSHPLPPSLAKDIPGEMLLDGRMFISTNSSLTLYLSHVFGIEAICTNQLSSELTSFSCPATATIQSIFTIESNDYRSFQSRFPIFPSEILKILQKSFSVAAAPPPPPPPLDDDDITFGKYKITDPLFPEQWHLWNRKNPGYDVNVRPVWKMGIYGAGITVLIIDDGIKYDHKDIAPAFRANSSYDFNENTPLPNPKTPKDNHGTRCAGQIVGQPNGICGVGVAFEAQVAGIRMLSKPIQTTDEAKILSYHLNENHIFSCSWGPFDDGKKMEMPDLLNFKAMVYGILHGRFELGTIYIFAAGNGGQKDNCNYDGYANSVFTIAIGAIDEDDESPFYMEDCAAQLFVTYSSGRRDMFGFSEKRKIITTDIGSDTACTRDHGGTSAAAPLGAGLIALMLSSRPELTWRDVQAICIEAAVAFGPLLHNKTEGWQQNGGGLYFHHKFGFGKADAHRMVQLAQGWKRLNKHVLRIMPKIRVERQISWNPVSVGFRVQNDPESDPNHIMRLEHVTVMVEVEFDQPGVRGDLEYYLQSPHGTVSQLTHMRSGDANPAPLVGWTFSTVAFWHEQLDGEWIFYVVNGKAEEYGRATTVAIIRSLSITFWGEGVGGGAETAEYKQQLEKKYIDAYFGGNGRQEWKGSFKVSNKRAVPWPPVFVPRVEVMEITNALEADTTMNRVLYVVGIMFSAFVLVSVIGICLIRIRRFRRLVFYRRLI